MTENNKSLQKGTLRAFVHMLQAMNLLSEDKFASYFVH